MKGGNICLTFSGAICSFIKESCDNGENSNLGQLTTQPTTNQLATQRLYAPFVFRLINNHNKKVAVYWINYSNQEIPYASLNPGQSYEQQSYVGHEWLVRGQGISDLKFTAGRGKFLESGKTIKVSDI